MRISKELVKIALHDGSLSGASYDPAARELLLQVELSEDATPDTGWYGTLRFEDAVLISAEPRLEALDFSDTGPLYSIVDADYDHTLNRDGREGVVFYVQINTAEATQAPPFFLLKFAARAFKWEPDRSRANPYAD